MRQHRSIWVFVLVVVLLPFSVYGLVSWYQGRFQRLPVLGGDGHTVAGFRFQNQQGKTVSLQDWKGKIVVLNYFFTHCSSICPKMMYQMKRVQAYGGLKNLAIASFSVDPERDSVGRLKEYAQKFEIGGNWNLLTGDKKELYRLARNSFLITATDGDGGPDDFIHSEKLVLLDTQGRIRGFYNGTDAAEVAQLIKDLQKLAAEA